MRDLPCLGLTTEYHIRALAVAPQWDDGYRLSAVGKKHHHHSQEPARSLRIVVQGEKVDDSTTRNLPNLGHIVVAKAQHEHKKWFPQQLQLKKFTSSSGLEMSGRWRMHYWDGASP